MLLFCHISLRRYGTTRRDEENIVREGQSFVTNAHSLGTARTSMATPRESSGKPPRTWDVPQEHEEQGPTAWSTTPERSRAEHSPRLTASSERV